MVYRKNENEKKNNNDSDDSDYESESEQEPIYRRSRRDIMKHFNDIDSDSDSDSDSDNESDNQSEEISAVEIDAFTTFYSQSIRV